MNPLVLTHAALALAVLLPAVALAQAPANGQGTPSTSSTPSSQTINVLPPQGPSTEPPGFGRFGPVYQTQPQAVAQPANAGAPLFGQSWPRIGPDPSPRPVGLGRCPAGYIEPSNTPHVMHLVVCIVQQPNTALSFGRTSAAPVSGGAAAANLNSTEPYQSSAMPQSRPGQPLSSLPPSQERSQVNQCIGRPAGAYACGRGGTECCAATQTNPCFPGAFACSPSGMGIGPKTACCISK